MEVWFQEFVKNQQQKGNTMKCSLTPSMIGVKYWWFSLSRNKKIKSKPFNDRSYGFQML